MQHAERNFGVCVCECVCARTKRREAGCWPVSKRRRQDSVLVQALGEEGAGSVAVRNRNRIEKEKNLHADDTIITQRAGVAIDMLMRFHVCLCLCEPVFWLQSCLAAERNSLKKFGCIAAYLLCHQWFLCGCF